MHNTTHNHKIKYTTIMKVMKFGGTSVGTPARMKEVTTIITESGQPTFIVLSAMSGTTNSLIEISNYLYKKNPEGANEIINRLENKYMQHVEELYTTETYKHKIKKFLTEEFNYLRSFTKDLFTSFEEKTIVAQGELLSTNMMVNYLQEKGIKAVLINALDFMRIDKNGEPDLQVIKEKLSQLMKANQGYQIYLTQGFICRNAYGEVDNLQRGGSDYTASLVGAVLPAEEIQIWTDIDGMHNNDPRYVDATRPVRRLHFEEASELAYFGAKILHPTCIQPAKRHGIPVRLLNTMEPSAPGTLISMDTDKDMIKAVSAKDNITMVRVRSSHQLSHWSFIGKVFSVFEHHCIPIDMIASTETSISLTIERSQLPSEVRRGLEQLGTVEEERELTIICVVGDMEWENIGFEAQILKALEEIPVRMISYGGSDYNLSLLVSAADKRRTLLALSRQLFGAACPG